MRKIIGKLILFAFLIGSPVFFADARSGCCSHHGGVCGCECCDGSSLSSTCAPYYPSCNRPAYNPPALETPKITPKPTLSPTPTSYPKSIPIVSNTSDIPDTSEKDNSDGWWTIGILGVLGYVYYKVKKKKPTVLHGPNDHQWMVDNLKRNIAKDETERAQEAKK